MSLLLLLRPRTATSYSSGDYGYGPYGVGDYGTGDTSTPSEGGSSLYSLTVAADSPVTWYRMDAASGSIEVDRGSLGLSGLYVNSPTLNETGAVPNDTAVLFAKASSQWLAGADNDAYSIGTTGALSVEWWAKCSVLADTGIAERFVTKLAANISGGEWVGERYASGLHVFRVWNSSVTVMLSQNSFGFPSLNVWHHHVATAQNNGGTVTVKTYLDGALTDTQTFSLASYTNGPAKLGVGASPDSATPFPLNGIVDEVAIYSTALSPARVLAHFSAADEGATGGSEDSGTFSSPVEFDTIFALHPASVLGTGNNPDLLVNAREAV